MPYRIPRLPLAAFPSKWLRAKAAAYAAMAAKARCQGTRENLRRRAQQYGLLADLADRREAELARYRVSVP